MNYKLDLQLFGRRVRDYRKMQGLTQEKLAEVAELSVPYISRIEKGAKRASVGTLIKLAVALDVTVDDLLGIHPKSDSTADVQQLFFDCSPCEHQTLLEITTAVKEILRRMVA